MLFSVGLRGIYTKGISMPIVFLIVIFLLSGPVSLYAQCKKEDICEMARHINPFTILDKCPEAGPIIVECKKASTKTVKFLPDPEFVDNGDGTITDKVNHLLWIKKGLLKPMSLKEAEAFADSFILGDKMGWRLPTLPELKTLLYRERTHNSSGKKAWINPVFDDGKGHHYWTTTTCQEVTSIEDRYQKKICREGDSAVWLIHFNIGAIFWHHITSKIYDIWLVSSL